MAGRDDPRWSARATVEEDRILTAAATRHGVKKGTMLRAAVHVLEQTSGQVVAAVLSGLGEKVPAAATGGTPAPAAGAASSPAPAEPRPQLVDVVMNRLDVRRPFAVQAIRQGRVKVNGEVCKVPALLVVPSEVAV